MLSQREIGLQHARATPNRRAPAERITSAGSAARYRADIDGLRAVAVVPVVLFHAGFPAFGGGFVGVDVFFVISGYLITSIILEDIDAGRFSVISFYERRIRRIFPALFATLLAATLIATLILLPEQLKDFGQSVVAATLFGSNVLFWQEFRLLWGYAQVWCTASGGGLVLGGLNGLAVAEADALDHLGEALRAIQPAPVPLGRLGELENHRQARSGVTGSPWSCRSGAGGWRRCSRSGSCSVRASSARRESRRRPAGCRDPWPGKLLPCRTWHRTCATKRSRATSAAARFSAS